MSLVRAFICGMQRERTVRSRRAMWPGALALPALILVGTPAWAQSTPPTTEPPGLPNLPLGTIKLPEGAPPTGLQAPLPKLLAPIASGIKPLTTSPQLRAISAAVASRPLTINDAVAVALATNRSLALSIEALLLAQGRRAEAAAAFNPTVALGFTYTQLSQDTTASFNGTTFVLSSAEQPVFNTSVTLPLDIAGLLRTATQQAALQEVAARIDINRTRNQLVSDVKTAFYQVLQGQALVAVAQDTLQNSLDRLDDARKKFVAGTVARFDVIRAQTDVANAQQQLIQARTNVSQYIATLNDTMGIDSNTPTQVTDQGAVDTPPGTDIASTTSANPPDTALSPSNATPTPPSSATVPAPGNAQAGLPLERRPVVLNSLALGPEYDAVLREALQTRPDILEQQANLAAARKGIRLAYRSYLPTLGVSIGGSYSPNAAGFSPQLTTGQIALSLAVPIWDGGVARARVEQARANVGTAITNLRQAEDTVKLDVRRSYLTLIQARDQVAVANQALAQAQEGFRLARVRYNAGVSSTAGVSPLLEVSDAQSALTQAETNQVNALYTYNNARSTLDRAIGRYSYTPVGPGYNAPPSQKTVGATK